MSERRIIIDVNHVSKEYQRGQIGSTTLQHELQSWWAKRWGREDPNSTIGGKPKNPNERFRALDDVSLQVFAGESLGIIGRNGAGKSTLLKVLSRITAPTEGSVNLYGRITSMLEVGTGFNGELTGRENIYVNGAILGMSRAEVDRKMADIIAFSELEAFIDTPVKRYSSGMYTKLGFSVAVNLNSEIIIMDEVLAVGDVAFQNKCIHAMKNAVSQQGRTVLYVSHNMGQIRRLCDRCVVLDGGRIVFAGETEKAVEYYLNASMNEDVRRSYLDYPRPDWLRDDRMRLLSAEYPKKETILVEDGELLPLKLKWHCTGDIAHVGLRIEVQSLAEQRLGTYVLHDICSCQQGETVEVSLELDVSRFKENTYRVIYCFFTADQLGGYLNADRVEGLSFARVVNKGSGELKWDFREWGYLQLDGAQIVRVDKT